jgi:hypothetical protein
VNKVLATAYCPDGLTICAQADQRFLYSIVVFIQPEQCLCLLRRSCCVGINVKAPAEHSEWFIGFKGHTKQSGTLTQDRGG